MKAPRSPRVAMTLMKRWLAGSGFRWRLMVRAMFPLRRLPGMEGKFQALLHVRAERERDSIRSLLEEFAADRRVMSGPFAGMAYPTLDAAGSMMAPKLLGGYEAEIAGIFRADLLRGFPRIINIGCGEGYYAVGCAISAPESTVMAYDLDERARRLCEAMAAHNHVEDRVKILPGCAREDLEALMGQRCLVICDCEGHEGFLFVPGVIECLAESDLVIEVHGFAGIDAEEFAERFRNTHQTELIRSEADFDKALTRDLGCLGALPLEVRLLLVGECRPGPMQWLVARSKARIPVTDSHNASF